MEIKNLRPAGAGLLFDVQMSPTVRLLNWTAKPDPCGRVKVFPPTSKHGSPTAIVHREILEQIGALVHGRTGDRPIHATTE